MATALEIEQALQKIDRLLEAHPSLMDAYQQLEPMILSLFEAQRMSIFQRRRQHQDLVARFKTGKETRQIKVPISPQSIAGYVALTLEPERRRLQTLAMASRPDGEANQQLARRRARLALLNLGCGLLTLLFTAVATAQ